MFSHFLKEKKIHFQYSLKTLKMFKGSLKYANINLKIKLLGYSCCNYRTKQSYRINTKKPTEPITFKLTILINVIIHVILLKLK